MIEYPMGATPLDPDEAEGLIPKHISTQNQLNEWEQNNILSAELWLKRAHLTTERILDHFFARKLHKQMFGSTWAWAGNFRKSNKNIGIDWPLIPTQLQKLLDDYHYHLDHKTYNLDETATRFHHQLVSIHPFPNGNGRHARLMADALLLSQGTPRFSWGMHHNLAKKSTIREQYIKALRRADQGFYDELILFVRS